MKLTFQDWIALLGRVLMSAIFIHGGVMKALAPHRFVVESYSPEYDGLIPRVNLLIKGC